VPGPVIPHLPALAHAPLGLPPSPSLPQVVAEKLNWFRYLSHFRSVHRGAYFAGAYARGAQCCWCTPLLPQPALLRLALHTLHNLGRRAAASSRTVHTPATAIPRNHPPRQTCVCVY
jgi:hypothetical protein